MHCIGNRTQGLVSSSIFVGAEREDNLIRNDPDKSEFAKNKDVFLAIFSFECPFSTPCTQWPIRLRRRTSDQTVLGSNPAVALR